ncbi:MAG: Ig-like domain-containing protein [Lachnospiraceae bacterium]|nr:Ig-like domain-containing protein [Lachnospiraceae bacterium]
MLNKKFFAKAFALAMATGLMTVAAPAVAQVWAADPSPAPTEAPAKTVSAKIDYDSYTLTIKPEAGDNYVFLAVVKKAGDEEKKWTIYPYAAKGDVTIDLSFLKVNKENLLKVWGDTNTTKVDVTVAAQPAKIKLKYANAAFPVQGDDEADPDYLKKVATYAKTTLGIAADSKEKYQIKTLYGGAWGDIDFDNMGKVDPFATMKVAGTTILVRLAPLQDQEEDKDAKTEAVVGRPAGAEVKVKIPASPKAPKVAIDYAKGTIKLPKKAEYGIFVNNELKYVSLADGGSLTPAQILAAVAEANGIKDVKDGDQDATEYVTNGLKDGFTLVVRTNDDKKGTSMPAFVEVKAAPTFSDDEEGKLLAEDGKTAIATYAFTDKDGAVLTFTTGAFEYKDAKGAWKKLSSGKGVKGVTSLTVRIAGVKGKTDAECSFPSSTEVTIAKDLTAATLTASAKTVEVGKSDLTLTVTAKNKKGEDAKAADISTTYKSSDATVATVAADGKVSGLKAGKVTITAEVTVTTGDKSTKVEATVEIEVTAAAE